MGELTRDPRRGEDILSQFVSLKRDLRRERIVSVVGGMLNQTDGGKTLTITPEQRRNTLGPSVTWWAKITGALQLTVPLGKMYLKGVSLSIASWPANGIVNLTDNATTWAWLAVSFSAATATWTTGSADPGDGTDTVEYIRIFKAVAASGTITELLICQDFRLPGNA